MADIGSLGDGAWKKDPASPVSRLERRDATSPSTALHPPIKRLADSGAPRQKKGSTTGRIRLRGTFSPLGRFGKSTTPIHPAMTKPLPAPRVRVGAQPRPPPLTTHWTVRSFAGTLHTTAATELVTTTLPFG